MNREADIEELELYAKFQQAWDEGFEFAVDYYDGIIDEMHRAVHPDQAFSYKKCFESPCKDIE